MIAILAGLMLGCESVPVDDAQSVPEPPPGTMPASAAITYQPPIDTDANQFTDTVGAIVYLFPKPNEYPLPIWTWGSFRFTLRSADDDTVLGSWTFASAEANDRRFRTQIGPCYLFELSLLDAGFSDEFSRRACELEAVFTPADGGDTVDGRISFQLGG